MVTYRLEKQSWLHVTEQERAQFNKCVKQENIFMIWYRDCILYFLNCLNQSTLAMNFKYTLYFARVLAKAVACIVCKFGGRVQVAN